MPKCPSKSVAEASQKLEKTYIAPYSPFLDGSWNLTGCCGRHECQKRCQSHGTLSHSAPEQPPGKEHFWCIINPYLHPFALGLLLGYSCLLCVSLTRGSRDRCVQPIWPSLECHKAKSMWLQGPEAPDPTHPPPVFAPKAKIKQAVVQPTGMPIGGPTASNC